MPPVIVAIGVGIFTGVAYGVAWGIAAAVAYYFISDAMMPDIPDYDNSPTYQSDRIRNTIAEGVSVARCYGQCKIGGNKIRFSGEKNQTFNELLFDVCGDPAPTRCIAYAAAAFDHLKTGDPRTVDIIVGHCLGEVEGILSYFINDIEWSELENSVGIHTKTEYTGGRDQSIDPRFPQEVMGNAFRGIAYSAFTFFKDDQEIGYDPHFTVEMQGLKLSGSWDQKADFCGGGTTRWDTVSCGVGGIVYGGTGSSPAEYYLKDWWGYDPIIDSWVQKADFPGASGTGMTKSVMAAYGTKIYVGMGVGASGNQVRDWWEYETATDTWTQKTDFPGFLGGKGIAATCGDNAYVGIMLSKELWGYNFSSDSWAQKADFPGCSRFDATCAAVGEKIYVGTGYEFPAGGLDDWWEYDTAINTWAQKSDFIGTARMAAACVGVGEDIFLIGGTTYSERFDDCFKYDSCRDVWRHETTYGGAPFSFGTASYANETIYVGSGSPANKQFWAYMPKVFSRNNSLILQDWYRNVEDVDVLDLDLNDFSSLEVFCDEIPDGGTTPRYRFDYNFDVNIPVNDAKKVMFAAINGRVIMSQGKLKPVWDSDQMADGTGGLTAKTASHAFTEDNIVRDSLTWNQPERPNIVRIHYIDSNKKYQHTSCEKKDEYDIEVNGEILYEEKCMWITDGETARRRCQFKYNKFLYTDFNVRLSSFSSASDLEIYDLVTLTHQLPGWVNKQFIIISKSEDMAGVCQFDLESYYPGIYSDTGIVEQPGYGSGLYNPFSTIGDQIYIKTYDDANISGLTKVLKIQNQPGGTYYYFKIYPTISVSVNPTQDDLGIDLHSLHETNVYGTPKIFEFISDGITYYIKGYPTVSSENVSDIGVIINPQIRNEANVEGIPRVAAVDVNGTEYYFKLYPERT